MLQVALSLVTCGATTTQEGTGHWPEQLGEIFFFLTTCGFQDFSWVLSLPSKKSDSLLTMSQMKLLQLSPED